MQPDTRIRRKNARGYHGTTSRREQALTPKLRRAVAHAAEMRALEAALAAGTVVAFGRKDTSELMTLGGQS